MIELACFFSSNHHTPRKIYFLPDLSFNSVAYVINFHAFLDALSNADHKGGLYVS
ncbi:hypothetical protein [Pantoea agglomerans]|uniref:hypothetical protein n=1 Tax=Enterobacter agglomerans TaxID=549 RepID=UPI00241319F0|nr:hypothetical protein [Pantoea agglomerans]